MKPICCDPLKAAVLQACAKQQGKCCSADSKMSFWLFSMLFYMLHMYNDICYDANLHCIA